MLDAKHLPSRYYTATELAIVAALTVAAQVIGASDPTAVLSNPKAWLLALLVTVLKAAVTGLLTGFLKPEEG